MKEMRMLIHTFFWGGGEGRGGGMYNIASFGLMVRMESQDFTHTGVIGVVHWDRYMFLGNCPPTPPLKPTF